MPRMFTDDKGTDWINAADVENDYETYVKYIVVENIGRPSMFDDLAHEVNKFIEAQSDSFIPEGPLQISDNFIVQALINEDEM